MAALLILGSAPAIAQLTPEQRCIQFAQNNGDFATFDPVTGICHEFGPNTNNNFNIVDPVRNQLVRDKIVGALFQNHILNQQTLEKDIEAQVDALRALGLSDEAINLLYQTEQVPLLITTRSQLGMYVSPGATEASAFGGAAVTRNSGYGLTDSAGLLAPGTRAPSFKDLAGGGGIAGSIDVSSNLPANQSLRLSGFFDYKRVDATLGALAGLGAASAGSSQTDTYRFGGSFIYGFGSAYLKGKAAFDFGHGSERQTVDGSTGRFDTQGYSTDLRVGNVFMLLNTISVGTTRMPTKAPPKAAEGYAVGFDLSGHVGYSNERVNGFTDSAGFVWGKDQTRYGDVGGRAELFAVVPNNGLVWMPYVAGTVDQQFGFKSTLTIPDQVALPGGDIVSLQQAQTFLGTQLGLDVRGAGGWKIGARGFYSASSDTNITGGSAYVKIPFNYTSAVAARY